MCLVDGVIARRCYCCHVCVLDGVVATVVMIVLVGDLVVGILVVGVVVAFRVVVLVRVLVHVLLK